MNWHFEFFVRFLFFCIFFEISFDLSFPKAYGNNYIDNTCVITNVWIVLPFQTARIIQMNAVNTLPVASAVTTLQRQAQEP